MRGLRRGATKTNCMELSERFIQQLEKEGFSQVYEWQDVADTQYPEQTHDLATAYMVTDGSVTFQLSNTRVEVLAGDRFDVPPQVPYSIRVGPHGWIGIIGES
jgi:quercetin dioxygenase-like cupin family protein